MCPRDIAGLEREGRGPGDHTETCGDLLRSGRSESAPLASQDQSQEKKGRGCKCTTEIAGSYVAWTWL